MFEEFLPGLDSEDSEAIDEAQRLCTDIELYQALVVISSNYKPLVDSISSVEAEGLQLSKAILILDKVSQSISSKFI